MSVIQSVLQRNAAQRRWHGVTSFAGIVFSSLVLTATSPTNAAVNDLWLIKTTGASTIELHRLPISNGYKSFNLQTATYFGQTENGNGYFQTVGNDLYYIKTKNTGSGKVEIHSAKASGYGNYSLGLHTATYFSSADAANGTFQMVGNTLWYIATNGTGSGKVEVHTATAASGYKSGIHAATYFSYADAANGTFQVVGDTLWYIKKSATDTRTIEVHTATAASGYKSGGHSGTWFSTADANNGYFQIVGNDLFFVKTQNTGSGWVEVHNAAASKGYSGATVQTATGLLPGHAAEGRLWLEEAAAAAAPAPKPTSTPKPTPIPVPPPAVNKHIPSISNVSATIVHFVKDPNHYVSVSGNVTDGDFATVPIIISLDETYPVPFHYPTTEVKANGRFSALFRVYPSSGRTTYYEAKISAIDVDSSGKGIVIGRKSSASTKITVK
jgi:hypothetical protein